MLLFLLAACTPDGADPADCPVCPEPVVQASSRLEDWEMAVIEPDLARLREGIFPVGEQGFGICKGATACEVFLGPEPGELDLGTHILRAELSVPRMGSDWQVRFDLDCTVTTPAGNELPVNHSKAYGVVHTGPKRGYQLSPLWKIQSPHPQGARDCAFSLTPIRPDGQDGTPVSGHYKTPMPETP